MKCLDALQLILGGDEKEFSPELRAHLESCTDCRHIQARNRAVLQLISLKRYEKPDVVAEARCRAKIREAIATPEPSLLRLWETITAEAWAPVRLSAAAVLVALAGLYAVSFYQKPVPNTGAAVQAQEEPVMAGLPFAAVSNPVPAPPLAQVTEPVLILASNQEPDSIQYGTQPSIPVKFEP